MRRRCTILRLLVLFIGLLMWARPSVAQERTPKSAVVVIDAGTADLFTESLVRATVESELGKLGYSIVTGVSVGGDTPAKLLACSGELACAAAVMKDIAGTVRHLPVLAQRRARGRCQLQDHRAQLRGRERPSDRAHHAPLR